jgi:hypothetical protein
VTDPVFNISIINQSLLVCRQDKGNNKLKPCRIFTPEYMYMTYPGTYFISVTYTGIYVIALTYTRIYFISMTYTRIHTFTFVRYTGVCYAGTCAYCCLSSN